MRWWWWLTKKWDIKGSLFQKDKHLNWLNFFFQLMEVVQRMENEVTECKSLPQQTISMNPLFPYPIFRHKMWNLFKDAGHILILIIDSAQHLRFVSPFPTLREIFLRASYMYTLYNPYSRQKCWEETFFYVHCLPSIWLWLRSLTYSIYFSIKFFFLVEDIRRKCFGIACNMKLNKEKK